MSIDKPHILAIDDEPTLLEFLKRALPGMGYEVSTARDGPEGLALCSDEAFDLVLVDLEMPGMDGIEVTRELMACDPNLPVVILTAYGSIASAVQAMMAGAADYLTKPVDLDHLEVVLARVLERRSQAEEIRLLREQVARQGSFEGLVGISPEMQKVYGLIRRVADSDATVLIQGETGTGKELVAQAIHNLSGRREVPFMPINCGALPESILESELFGHEKGSFTGAVKRKYGLIEQAEGGTLFLDEIEEMSPALQVKLLRAIQEKEVLRVGGDRPIPVDFRLIASTNVDLRERMEREMFRADLFYRLSVVVVDIPPLRARAGDIPLLARYFSTRYAERSRRAVPEVSPEAMMVLKTYSWPGNVREMENAVEQALVLSDDNVISLDQLPRHILEAARIEREGELCDVPIRQARERFERRYLERVLELSEGRVAEAAGRAGINRQHFYAKLKQHGISRGEARGSKGSERVRSKQVRREEQRAEPTAEDGSQNREGE